MCTAKGCNPKTSGSRWLCPDLGRVWRAIKSGYLSENFFLPLLSPNGRPRHDGRPDTLAAEVGARSVRCRFPERHKTLTFSWIRSSMVLGSSLGSRLERCAPTEDTVNRTTANYRLFYQSVGRVPRKYHTYTVVAQ